MSLSHYFSSRYNDDSKIPPEYRSSVFCLEKLSTSSISLTQLEAKFQERLEILKAADANSGGLYGTASYTSGSNGAGSNAGAIAYIQNVLERISHIERIANQLGENISRYPPLYFPPGKLLDELALLIVKKESELLETKRAQMNKQNVSLCMNYLRSTCSRGVTCNYSHTGESLITWLQAWLERQILEHGEYVLTVAEDFGADAWGTLLDLVAKRGTFQTLVLRSPSRDAIRVLVAALSMNAIASLKRLDLGKSDIGENFPRGILKLSKALGHNMTLTSVNLGHNSIGAAGALAIAQSLSRSSFSVLTALNLQSNSISVQDSAFQYFCTALSQTTKLVKLGFGCNDLGPEGVRRILESCAGMKDLAFLDLGSVGMADSGASHLGAFLRDSEVGRRMRYLNVGWNRIGNEGCAAICEGLSQCQKMEIFRMHYNVAIGRKGAIALSEFVKAAPVLHVLDIRWLGLGDDGASVLFDPILSSPSLKDVSFFGNELSAQTETVFLDKLRKKGAAWVKPVLPDGAELLTRHDESW